MHCMEMFEVICFRKPSLRYKTVPFVRPQANSLVFDKSAVASKNKQMRIVFGADAMLPLHK